MITGRMTRRAAVAGDGVVDVADQGNHRLRKISGITTTNGTVVETVVGASDLDGRSGVAIDSAGWIYVVESVARRVRMVSPEWGVSTLASRSGERDDDSFPMGIAVDSTRVLYIADRKNHVIHQLTREGVLTVLAGAEGQVGYL